MNTKQRILVIHALRPTSRQTTIDHLLSFRQYLSNADVQYLHFAQPLPRDIENGLVPDLTIINYDFLNYRFSPLWPYVKNRFRGAALRGGKTVAIVQDEFWAHRLLDGWCRSWKVDRVLTGLDRDVDVLLPWTVRNAEVITVLNGYTPSSVPPYIPLLDRTIDLGQRVRSMPPHLGRYASEKSLQALKFARLASEAGFGVDVSTSVSDSFLGYKWLDFLSNCRFTVGMKGGASIADPYGLLYVRSMSKLSRGRMGNKPIGDSRFLDGRDGKNIFSAISPRLLEAAATRTCQILRRDDYLGILTPWEDYIPLERDFRNAGVVLTHMRDLEQASQIAENAHKKLVASGRFSSSQLAMSASEGLCASGKGEADKVWQQLASLNARLGEVCNRGLTDLHDASISLIKESRLGKMDLNSATAKRVSQEIERLELIEWYDELTQLTEHQKIVQRVPWVWRPVPTPLDHEL